MPAPRKPVGEKAIPRAYVWRPWVDEFLSTLRPGSRSGWLNDLVEASPEFRAWWEAIKQAEDDEIRAENRIRFERIDAEEGE